MNENWLHLVGNFRDTNTIKPCPNCGKSAINFQFVGDINTHIGHLYLWCNSCFHGIHVSRVQIPNGVNVLPYDISVEELSKIVPKYKLVS